MKRSLLLLAIGALLGGAFSAALAARLARLTYAELRHLHIVILEVKRRMSTARVVDPQPCDEDRRPWVSFHQGGDPEGYSKSAKAFIGSRGSVWDWLSGAGLTGWPETEDPT